MSATVEGAVDSETPGSPAHRAALRGQVEAAAEVYRAVVAHLEQALDGLRGSGTPPSYRLLHELGDCHRLFLRLRREVVAAGADDETPLNSLADLARALGGPAPIPDAPAPDEPAPVDAPSAPAPPPEPAPAPLPAEEPGTAVVAALPTAAVVVSTFAAPPAEPLDPATLEAIAAPRPSAWEPAAIPAVGDPWPPSPGPAVLPPDGPSASETDPDRERAELAREVLPTLDRVLAIRPRDGAAVTELTAAFAAAHALRVGLESDEDPGALAEARRLRDGDHPLAHLLTMIRGDDALSDDDWSRLHDSVGDAFGRALAVVAARNRLVSDD